MKLYFDDENFDGQLQRSVGKADPGMANVGECLAIAGQITPGDRDSWYRAWSGFARAAWPSRARRRWPRATGSALAASCCGRLSISGRRSSFTGTTSTARSSGLPTPRASPRSGTRSRCSTHGDEVLADGLSGYLFAPRPVMAGCRPSSTSAGTTPPPRSCTPRRDRRLPAATYSRRSMVPARDRCCTTGGSPCGPTGKTSCPRCSTRSSSPRTSIPAGRARRPVVRRPPRAAGRVRRASSRRDDRGPGPARNWRDDREPVWGTSPSAWTTRRRTTSSSRCSLSQPSRRCSRRGWSPTE